MHGENPKLKYYNLFSSFRLCVTQASRESVRLFVARLVKYIFVISLSIGLAKLVN